MERSLWVQGVLDIEIKDSAIILKTKGREIFRVSADEITRISSLEERREKKKVVEGYLSRKPYLGNTWFLFEDRDREYDIVLRGVSIDSVLSDFEGKRVRITIEVVEKEK